MDKVENAKTRTGMTIAGQGVQESLPVAKKRGSSKWQRELRGSKV